MDITATKSQLIGAGGTDFWQSPSSSSCATAAAAAVGPFFYSPSQQQTTVSGASALHSSAHNQRLLDAKGGGANPVDGMPPPTIAGANGRAADSAFHAAAVAHSRPQQPFAGGPSFDLFRSAERDFHGIAVPAQSAAGPFRPPPIGAANFGGPIGSAATPFAHNFSAGLFHSAAAAGGPQMAMASLPSAAAVVASGFDCVGLMNNFGLNSMAGHSAAFPSMGAPNPHSSSAALMNAIYASGGGGAHRQPPNLLHNYSIAAASTSRPPMPQAQSASPTRALAAAGHAQYQQQIQQPAAAQMFGLGSVANNNPGTTAADIMAAVSSANNSCSFAQQNHFKLGLESAAAGLSGDIKPAFGMFQTKAGAEMAAKMPKETATIPMESSRGDSASSSADLRPQPQLSCQVCHLAASNGLHFGARTCAACAAFFRRSISDQKRYICKRSQRCVIRPGEAGTQGYRKMCRNCRMKRCLEIGMLPENVQNKRNKREFYFVDAFHNVIQQNQQGGEQTQQEQEQRRQQELGAGGLEQPLNQQQQQQQQQPQQLLAIKCEPGENNNNFTPKSLQQQTDKSSDSEKATPVTAGSNLSMGSGDDSHHQQQQQQHTIGQLAHQNSCLSANTTALIGGMAMDFQQQQQPRPMELFSKNVNAAEGRPLFSNTTGATTNPQQPMPFPWIPTLREI